MLFFIFVEGYRFLIVFGEDEDEIIVMMVSEIDYFCDCYNIFGCYFFYVDLEWYFIIKCNGFINWFYYSYIW